MIIITLPINVWIPAVITLAIYAGMSLLPSTKEVTVSGRSLLSDISLKIAMTSRRWFAASLSLAVWIAWSVIGGAA